MQARPTTVVAIVLCLLTALLAAPPAQAAQVPHDRIVSANPADWTPHVLDGEVNSIVQVGQTMYVGGSFTEVQEAGPGNPILARRNAFAFDAQTGTVSPDWVPDPDGEVNALKVAADASSVYAVGGFNNIGPAPARVQRVARLDLNTGSALTGFRAPTNFSKVNDAVLARGRLYITGEWKTIGGIARPVLAALDATTGALDPHMDLVFSNPRPNDFLKGISVDVSPDQRTLAVLGGFGAVNGLARQQLALIDISGAKAQVKDWATDGYQPACALKSDGTAKFPMYVRDVEFSPDGTYFAVVTTGGFSSKREELCDTTARFETLASGPGQKPSWIAHTGGDTLHTVAITGPAIYVGGHQRWMNNPFGADVQGPGGVPREGIAALDPRNGLPYAWNPGRTRGVGVFDMLSTDAGLWLGSDTVGLGSTGEPDKFEYHGRLGMFPLAGQPTIPPDNPGTLPGDLFVVGTSGTASPAWGTANVLTKRPFDGTTAQAATELPAPSGTTWSSVRGAFMLSGTLYYGQTDGTFVARTFDGANFGPATTIDLYRGTFGTGDVPNLSGLFFDQAQGRIYFTVKGSSQLHYRYFTPESGVVGAIKMNASPSVTGISFGAIAGMTAVGDTLYFAQTGSPDLSAITLSDGVPVAGTARRVISAGAGTDWRSNGMFVLSQAGDGAEEPPPAEASPVSHRASAASPNVNSKDFRVTVPAGVQGGDGLVMFLSVNSASAVVSAPSGQGWTALQSLTSQSMRTVAWQKVASPSDAGSVVSVPLSSYAKGQLVVHAYDGTSTTAPVQVFAAEAETVSQATHTTPTVEVAQGGGWLVSYWADKSASSPGWTAPTGEVVRNASVGDGFGRISTLSTDGGEAVSAGTVGGVTATSGAPSNAATMWSVALAPESSP